jgi:hypothetical protein
MSIPADQLFPGFKTPPNEPKREVDMSHHDRRERDYDYDDFGDGETCDCCGGEGVIEYADHPEVWGEDCPSYKNHLLPCPECSGGRR